jgi:hypothetical protein
MALNGLGRLARHDHLTASLRQLLGDEHYQAARDLGRSAPEQQAVAPPPAQVDCRCKPGDPAGSP